MAMISLNLGLLNLMPIPVLDGGHIAILALEGVSRRDFSMKVKEKMLLAGFVLLLMLMVTVIYNDLMRIQWIEALRALAVGSRRRRARSWRSRSLAGVATTPFARAQERLPDPVATFSILGYDPATGEVGGAVQSRVFSVGNGVLWGEAEVGMVATQAIVDVSYGPQATRSC